MLRGSTLLAAKTRPTFSRLTRGNVRFLIGSSKAVVTVFLQSASNQGASLCGMIPRHRVFFIACFADYYMRGLKICQELLSIE